MKRIKNISLIFLLIVSISCKDKYVPHIEGNLNGNLVVEGFINLGTGPTIIQLSRVTGLDSMQTVFENDAQVEVQAESGPGYPLLGTGSGRYSIDQVPLIPGSRYRLHIVTKNGRNYVSDYSVLKITPPIDSVSWTTSGGSVSIFVTTHDPKNQTWYYQWQFEETWQYNAYYNSQLVYYDSTVMARPPNEQLFNCWRSDYSNIIAIATSSNLVLDQITQFPLTTVSSLTTAKLAVRYSILVKQYALSEEWYDWNEKIKKNTEQLGTIFDPQPSGTGGNMHCTTDSTEAVIGFVGCTTETDMRIFIDHTEVPGSYPPAYPEACSLDTLNYNRAVLAGQLANPINIPVEALRDIYGDTTGITVSGPFCTDCNLQGGSSIKPPYWQ